MCERLRRLLHLVIQLCQLPLWKSRMKCYVQSGFRMQILQKLTVNKDSTSSVSRKLVKACRSSIISDKHSQLKWTYFSKLLSSARDQRPMPSCFFPSAPLPVPGPYTLTSFASTSVRQSAAVVLYLKRPTKRPRSWANFEILDWSYQQNSPNNFKSGNYQSKTPSKY